MWESARVPDGTDLKDKVQLISNPIAIPLATVLDPCRFKITAQLILASVKGWKLKLFVTSCHLVCRAIRLWLSTEGPRADDTFPNEADCAWSAMMLFLWNYVCSGYDIQWKREITLGSKTCRALNQYKVSLGPKVLDADSALQRVSRIAVGSLLLILSSRSGKKHKSLFSQHMILGVIAGLVWLSTLHFYC